MNNLASAAWKKALNTGLTSGILAIMISLIGMVESFGDTFIINRFRQPGRYHAHGTDFDPDLRCDQDL